jgi:hypothetical protein
MGSKFLAHLRRQWMGALALFLVLTGGTAYAADTVFSSDIVNDQVYSADVRNDTLTGGGLAAADLRSGSVGTAEIGDNQVRSADVRDDGLSGGGLAASDLGPGSVGSSEVMDNSLGSLDVVEESMLFNNTLNANDIGSGAVGSAEVADSSLNDEDIAQLSIVNFTGTIGVIQAHDCDYKKVTGLPADNKDHFLLTPEVTTSESSLIYTPKWDASEPGDMWIQVCNVTGEAVNDGTTKFNLLEIDAE